MTPECFNGFNYQYADSLHDVFEDGIFGAALGTLTKHCDGFQQAGQRPRGGKKPLRQRQQQLNVLEAEYEDKLRQLREAQQEKEKLMQRIKVNLMSSR